MLSYISLQSADRAFFLLPAIGSWTVITESAVPRIRRIFFDITVPLVNNTSKLYIEYSFAGYYKAIIINFDVTVCQSSLSTDTSKSNSMLVTFSGICPGGALEYFKPGWSHSKLRLD